MMHQPRRQKLTADLWAKAGELEKQFASYKKKVEKSDQAKEESSPREKKDGGRGELYERYMRIRDVKLREESNLRMERKGAEMVAMWEKLEKSRAEMAARSGGAGMVAPVRTPSKTVQVRRENSDEKKSRDATPRSTSAKAKKPGTISQITTSNSQPSPTRAVPQSPKRSNSNSTNRIKSLPRLNSPTRSGAIFADLRKEGKTPTTPRTRVLTKSHSLVLEKTNAKVPQKKPPQTVNITLRVNETDAPIEFKEDDKIFLEETPRTGSDTIFEPFVTIEDNILPKLQENLTNSVKNKETEEEIPSQEMFDHVKPNIENNYSNDNANDTIINNVYSILNPSGDKEGESSDESSRSWCSNLETSFSRSIDLIIDSPILSPHGSGSTSFRFLPEPTTTIRVRKKGDSRSINSPRGITSLLSFGKKNKGNEVGVINDESDSDFTVLNRMSLVSYESNGSRNEIESENGDRLLEYQQAHALAGSLASSGAKYDQKEDPLSINTQKSHRSFFTFPPFLFRGAESKIRQRNS